MRDATVALAAGARVPIRGADGPLRPFVLVPALAAGPRSWDAVATRLAEAGHTVVTVGPGGPDAAHVHPTGAPDAAGAPGEVPDPDARADHLAELIGALGFTGGRAPIVAGQAWGGRVAVSLAARRAGIAAVGCVEGGWAPATGGFDPLALYPHVEVPALLCAPVPTGGPQQGAGPAAPVAVAAAGMPRSRTSWYLDAAPDLVAHLPRRVADDLLTLAVDAEPAPAGTVAPGAG